MGAPLRSTLGFIFGVWCMLSLGAKPMPLPGGPEIDLFERVNRVRAEHHLIELAVSSELSAVARAHAADMAERGYLSHTDPSGRSPLDRVQQAGVSGFRMLAENIGSSDVSGDRLDSIVQAWLASPVHRQNLLHPAFNASGIGLARTASGRTIAVQLFATY
jgi:uncharacterized protein YkwD